MHYLRARSSAFGPSRSIASSWVVVSSFFCLNCLHRSFNFRVLFVLFFIFFLLVPLVFLDFSPGPRSMLPADDVDLSVVLLFLLAVRGSPEFWFFLRRSPELRRPVMCRAAGEFPSSFFTRQQLQRSPAAAEVVGRSLQPPRLARDETIETVGFSDGNNPPRPRVRFSFSSR
ncbi:hypothetical protein DAI22_10g081001 [Oryza sativa Japonica Group]|nr:hypothetical protein DAI22_10g081001 [Oryza sativa Japonica Group]